MFEQLVRACLFNWLGYGKLDSPIWFIGMEEGGAEIWRQGKQTLQSSLEIRSRFDLAMDFKTVWEDYYGIPLDSFVKRKGGMTVWHYMAAFLLSLDGVQPTKDKIRDYVFVSKKLGAIESNHFMCEFLPLPRRENNSIGDYQGIWSTVESYRREVMPKRFDLIAKTILDNTTVRLLVSYDKSFTKEILKYFDHSIVEEWLDERNKTFRLYQIRIENNRHVSLLVTPFFGQGQVSYDGLQRCAMRASNYLGS